jgi:hypothetical protein
MTSTVSSRLRERGRRSPSSEPDGDPDAPGRPAYFFTHLGLLSQISLLLELLGSSVNEMAMVDPIWAFLMGWLGIGGCTCFRGCRRMERLVAGKESSGSDGEVAHNLSWAGLSRKQM